MDDVRVVVGLGNPGQTYSKQRHNIGFEVLDALVSNCDAVSKGHKFKSELYEARCYELKVFFIKPQTFMNLSGEAVRDIKQFYKVNPEHILIVYDDIDLPFGTVKLRKKGSGGTHNGMKSIIQLTGSGAFPRVRVGIGPKPLKMDLAAFVLQSFGPEENHELPAILDLSVKAVDYWLKHGVEKAMNRVNSVKIDV